MGSCGRYPLAQTTSSAMQADAASRARCDNWSAVALLMGRKYEAGTGLELALAVDGALAGMCGLDSIDGVQRQAEIGYWLSRTQTGTGL